MLRPVLVLLAIALVMTMFADSASAFDWFWWLPGHGGHGGHGGPSIPSGPSGGGSSVPEIDPAAAVGALTLLVTSVAMFRQRRQAVR